MLQFGNPHVPACALRRPFFGFHSSLFVLLGLLFCSFLPAQAAPGEAPFAAVVALGGKPLVQHGKASKALVLRQSLGAGDIVETGTTGKVSILFSDGSQVRLGPGTRLQITEPVPVKNRTSFFRVIAGEVWARLRPGRGVQTEYSSLVVRGTDVHLAVAADGTTTLTVLEGEVQFASAFGEVTVHQSEQSVVHPGAAPTKPITVANPGLIVEWTLDLNRAALPREKSWTGLAGPQLTAEIMRRDALARNANTAENRRQFGDALFDAHQYQGALTQYNVANTLAPDEPQTALHRGYALLQLGQLDEANAAFTAANAGATAAEAQTGAAWVALERDNPAGAEGPAKLAVAGNPQSAEAHLVLALALMRQPGHEKAAETELQSMLTAQPERMRPQARAWLAQLALAEDDSAAATREANLAIKEAPDSALAHSAAASVAFYTGRSDQAAKYAARAVQLNPGSSASLLALGQAQLADGNADAAAATAARASALDPDSAPAFYLLGVADAQRRDYTHAARELRAALRLSPDYFAAASVLARVYVRMSREHDALALLNDMEARNPGSDTLLAALGETLYAQGKYKEALEQYRNAVKARPASALAWNGLARLALDANQLNEAIRAGQRATELAPGVGTYHSTLGLAYTYSGLDRQAEREFRTALAHDPNNALALVRLGLANREGDARVTNRTQGLSYVQGFILNPEVSRDLLRGGTNTELEGRPTSDGIGASVVNQATALDGDLHSFTNVVAQQANGPRVNDDTKFFYATNDTTFSPHPGTTIYLHTQSQRNRTQLPGTDRDPASDDESRFRFNDGILAVKQRMDDRATLWAGIHSYKQRTNIFNSNQDASFAFLTSGFVLATNVADQQTYLRSLDPEVRLDYKFSKSRSASSILTLGAARPRNISHQTMNIVLPGPPGLPSLFGNTIDDSLFPERVAYAQVTHQFGERASLAAQLRHVRYRYDRDQDGALGGFLTFAGQTKTSRSFWLPSMVGNFTVDRKTQLRLLAGRRKNEFTSSIFAPVATLLATEPQSVPNGYSDPLNGDMHVYELDVERRLGTGRLLKLFAFHSTGRNMVSDYSGYFNPENFDAEPPNDLILENNSLFLNKIKRAGLGARYEHQFGHSLFGQAGAAWNRTKGTGSFFDPFNQVTVTPLFNSGQAPYQPKFVANLGLNYVSTSGNKIGLFLNHSGAMYADTDAINATARPRFGAKTTFDIQFARERSVKHQLLLRVNNIFNTSQIVYNGVPTSQRRIILESTHRF